MTNYNKIELVQGDTYTATIKIANSELLTDPTIVFTTPLLGSDTISLTEGTDGWMLTIDKDVTAEWAPGTYNYSIIATNGDSEESRKTIVYKNTLIVLENPLPDEE